MQPTFKLGLLKGDWVVTWHEGGARKRFRLFPRETTPRTRREAETELARWIREYRAAVVEPTLAGLWEAYRADKQGRRIAEVMRKEWKLMGPFWGHLRAEDVTTAKCREWTAQRRARGTHDGTIWTELGHLRTVLKWAYEARMIDRAPKVERPTKPDPRDRFLTRAEAERLIDACNAPHVQLAVACLLGTAARVGAMLELRWDQVDLGRGIIALGGDLGGRRKGRATVPIAGSLRARLATARAAAVSEYVIEHHGRPVKSIKTGFNAAVRRAGLPHISPHDLRRTAARLMVEDGVSMAEVAQFLGHSDDRITQRVYGRFSVDYLRKAAGALEFDAKPKLRVVE